MFHLPNFNTRVCVTSYAEKFHKAHILDEQLLPPLYPDPNCDTTICKNPDSNFLVQYFEGRAEILNTLFEISMTITLEVFDGLLLTFDTLFGAGSGLISTEDMLRYLVL